MNKKRILVLALLAAAAVFLVFAVMLSGNRGGDCASIGDQASRDDCYHALSHASGNRRLCNNISDAEEREHCIGHIPE